jgi:hypothetical protein
MPIGSTLQVCHFNCPSPGILVTLLRAGPGSSQVFGQSSEGKLEGNNHMIVLRSNTLKGPHFGDLSPGILVACLRAGLGSASVFGQSMKVN